MLDFYFSFDFILFLLDFKGIEMSKTCFLNELADSVSSLNTFSINQLADSIGGKIYGSNDYKASNGFTGIFETLNEAQEGDIVIRHWINGKGVEIANEKNVAWKWLKSSSFQ